MKMKTGFSLLTICVASLAAINVYAAERTTLNEEAMFKVKADSLASRIINSQSFSTGASFIDAEGNLKVRINQIYQGLPIYGESFVATQNSRGDFQRFSGDAVSGIAQDLPSVEATVSSNEALATLAVHWKHQNHQFSHPEQQLVVWLDHKDIAHLAWQLSYVVYSEEPIRPIGFVDAHSGELLDTWDGLNHAHGKGPGGNQKTGRYEFGQDYPAFEVKQNGSTCSLDSENVETHDMQHRKYGGNIHAFPCFENSEREVNGAYSALNDAHAFGQVVFNMYKDWYGIAPISQKLKMRVHYDSNYENAFWDGRQMTFGDGKSYFYPLVSLDVVSHEVSHGVTQQNSNLEYKNQSGGINEAFSDIAGAAAIHYFEGDYNWKIGDRIKKGSGAMRHMDNPPLDGKSIGHAKDYYDGMDVHHSSGVFNKAFYLLSTTPNWNIRKGFNIFVKANQLYWTPRSTYDQASVGVVNAARDLGYCVDDVIHAFEKVGVDAGRATAEYCTDVPPIVVEAQFTATTDKLSVAFKDQSVGKVLTHYWQFGDGNTSAQKSPTHVYAASGSYNVSLTVTSASGYNDVYTQNVTVDDNITSPCRIEAWERSKSYSSGDEVSFEGKTYLANWWSTGAQPDLYPQVWKMTGNCDLGPIDNIAPVAAFSYSAQELIVSFSNTSSDDKAIVSQQWTFGDGISSTENNPNHIYATAGNYTVELLVKDAEGLTHSTTKNITLTDTPTTCSVAAWRATDTYNTGDLVAHKGQRYKAGWWTKNEEPGTTGQWGVWKALGPCE
ncbi:M4 family metallopeptidase [Enterovibrio norvegicus]|uniref:Vibriolysin n=1 Tax=Enterovibrio norvegicus DSM 15893 TaxID=1121869 RepID=A0A1I5U255_9GAMM|nr:M4 family metallopeptidase [Enterovibrio norvegicus]SFP88656.1 vibriolysin [Enterovibrio norvegicus DSM 15893]